MEHCQNYCFTSRLGCQITVSKNHSHPGCETVVLTVFRFVLTEHYTAGSRQQQGGMKEKHNTAQRREQRAAESLQLAESRQRQVTETGEEKRNLIAEKQIRLSSFFLKSAEGYHHVAWMAIRERALAEQSYSYQC